MNQSFYTWIHFLVGLIVVFPVIFLQLLFIIKDILLRKAERKRKKEEKNTRPTVFTPRIKKGYIKDTSNGDVAGQEEK